MEHHSHPVMETIVERIEEDRVLLPDHLGDGDIALNEWAVTVGGRINLLQRRVVELASLFDALVVQAAQSGVELDLAAALHQVRFGTPDS
ncbi:MAG: hypothetical protein ACXIVQ_12075 [Acidimicrobiales bacterium]